MLSPAPRGVARLLNSQPFTICRTASSPPACRYCDPFSRSQSTASNSSNDPPLNTLPYRRKPTHRNRSRSPNRSQRIEIGVSSLGKPGEVVIVQEHKRRPQFPTSLSQRQDGRDKNALPFMLEEIEKDTAPYDSAIVMERIESFRIKHHPGDKLTANDWEDLRTALQSSFTIQQLSDYVSTKRSHVPDPNDPGRHEGIRTEEWRPGVSVFLETGPVSQEGVADRVATFLNLKGKDILAERILRDCWQLGVINEIGQVDIRLPRHSLSLLLGSTHFSFEELASLHEVKIDITHSLGLVRVTGKQRSCESIREIAHDTTNRIREEEIELLSPDDSKAKSIGKALNSDFLAWVSNTYGVAFDQGSSPGPSRIFYLLENKFSADNARRTLNLAANYATSSPIHFSTYMSSSEMAGTHDVEPNNSMSWSDQQKAWFRWGVSSTHSKNAKTMDRRFFDKQQTRLSDELLKLLRQEPHLSTIDRGIFNVSESVTAAVGKCLFLRKSSLKERSVGASASQLGKMSLPRTFTTEIPRAAHFLRMLNPHTSDDGIQLHRIRLVPSALHAHIFPQLELHVTVKPSELDGIGVDCAISSAKAILDESSVDYLLPEAALDLRFTRKLSCELLGGPWENGSLDGLQSGLKDCFNRSMASDNEIPLPVFTCIPLPSTLLSPTHEHQDPCGSKVGEYFFPPVKDIQGTRIHQYEFNDRQLYYSFYESGPFNPQMMTDLFLEMGMSRNNYLCDAAPESEAPGEPLQREFNSFYNTACTLAFEASSA